MTKPVTRTIGLLSSNRQIALLNGLEKRLHDLQDRRQELVDQNQRTNTSLQQRLQHDRENLLARCRQQRHETLADWDRASEAIICDYETQSLGLRQELARLSVRFRKARKEEHATILRKVQARCGAVQHQYEARSPEAEKTRAEEYELIKLAATKLDDALDLVREVTMRRLSGLPHVDPLVKEDWETSPETVRRACEAIELAVRQMKETLRDLYAGTPSKLVDTFWILPTCAAGFVLVWSIGSLIFASDRLLIAVLVGIAVAFVLFLSVLGILQIPLRRQTRRIYPRAEHLAAAAQRAAQTGRAIADAKAKEFSEDLLKTRNFHLEAAERWKRENLAEIDKTIAEQERTARKELESQLLELESQFTKQMHDLDQRFNRQAERVAELIRQRINAHEQAAAQQQTEHQQQQTTGLQRFESRNILAVQRGCSLIASTAEKIAQQFPDWKHVSLNEDQQVMGFLPVGCLQVRQQINQAIAAAGIRMDGLPEHLPVALQRKLHAGLLIDCPGDRIEQAVAVVQAVLWRALTTVMPGRCRLTLIDPVGRGQHFGGLITLADHDPDLIDHRVWASATQIESRLEQRAQRNEDILQTCLRDRFSTIEDYNTAAAALAEPYRLIAIAGAPAGISDQAACHIRTLFNSAQRCGNFLFVIREPTTDWLPQLPVINDARWLRLQLADTGHWKLLSPDLQDLPFQPAREPSGSERHRLTGLLGKAAVEANHIEISLREVLAVDQAPPDDSSSGLRIPIGSQGAQRNTFLDLGDGVKQHVLISGKTGSGKSTLLHTIITAGALRYRPDQLHFYLLDFKKGVEFKPYADCPLPHARVIGIESEREFGCSVLERLNAELQTRGEHFRDAGVQELDAFRSVTGRSLPRILLVVDEFQELFTRDDRIASQCATFLDRLVRQGRSFGIHVILSSQSLAGASSLPRATLGQMAVRIALQSSESDAALILGEDNTAARLIQRPGEAIYNDASGLVEGNQPFQVALLSRPDHQAFLAQLRDRDQQSVQPLGPPLIFEGNRPTRWSVALAETAISQPAQPPDTLRGMLGEAIEIGPPTALALRPLTGRNILLVGTPETNVAVLCSAIPVMFLDWKRRHHNEPEIIVMDGNRDAPEIAMTPSEWFRQSQLPCSLIKPRDAETEMQRLHALLNHRLQACDGDQIKTPIVVVVTPLERFREFRQSDSFNYSLDSDSTVGMNEAMQALLRDGPQVGIHVWLCCNAAETLNRWLPRSTHHDLELRILGRMGANDSANLIDTPEASHLTVATMLLYDDSDGRIRKFRICDPPSPDKVAQWMAESIGC